MTNAQTNRKGVRLRRIRKGIALRDAAKAYAYAESQLGPAEIDEARDELEAAAVAFALDRPRRSSSVT
jgi:hypothetical protein